MAEFLLGMLEHEEAGGADVISIKKCHDGEILRCSG